MTQKERLVDLITGFELTSNIPAEFDAWITKKDAEEIANWLLSSGVIVPPCKVGDTVYILRFGKDGAAYIQDEEVQSIFIDHDLNVEIGIGFSDEWFPDSKYYVFAENIGETESLKNGKSHRLVFLTREEAEQALKERETKI